MHQGAQESGQLTSHLLMLPQRGMPGGTIVEVTVLWGEVKAVYFLVTVFFCLLHDFIQRFLCNLLAWQEVQLAADSFLDVVDDLLRCGDEEHLRVDAVFGL